MYTFLQILCQMKQNLIRKYYLTFHITMLFKAFEKDLDSRRLKFLLNYYGHAHGMFNTIYCLSWKVFQEIRLESRESNIIGEYLCK